MLSRWGRLYSDVKGYETFEAYCKQEWDFTGHYARYLIHSASVVENIKTVTMVTPSSERQARPLAYQLIASANVVDTVSPIGDKSPVCDLTTIVVTNRNRRFSLTGVSGHGILNASNHNRRAYRERPMYQP